MTYRAQLWDWGDEMNVGATATVGVNTATWAVGVAAERHPGEEQATVMVGPLYLHVWRHRWRHSTAGRILTALQTADRARGARACRRCGCTDRYACPGGCAWSLPDVCSTCAPDAVRAHYDDEAAEVDDDTWGLPEPVDEWARRGLDDASARAWASWKW